MTPAADAVLALRLVDVRSARTAAAGGAVLAVAALLLTAHDFVYLDAQWQLVWGAELAEAGATSIGEGEFLTSTPHVLPILLAAAGSLVFGADDLPEVWLLATRLSFVLIAALAAAIVAGVSRSTLAGVLVAVVVISRPLLLQLGTIGSYDLLYVACVLGALLLLALPRRSVLPALALLAFAGLVRQDGWVLTGFVLGALLLGERRLRWSWIAVAAAAPLATFLFDLWQTGDALFSISFTQDAAEDLERDTGFRALWLGPVRLLQAATVEAGLLALAVLAPAVLHGRARRLPDGLALLSLVAGAFLVSMLAGAPIQTRYALVPGILLLCVAALAMRELAEQRGRRSMLVGLVLVPLALAGARLGDLQAVEQSGATRAGLEDDLERVLGGLDRCRALSVPSDGIVPFAAPAMGDVLRVRVDRNAEAVLQDDGRAAATLTGFASTPAVPQVSRRRAGPWSLSGRCVRAGG